MIAAFDVYYRNTFAVAAGLVFQNWLDDKPIKEYTVQIDKTAEYIPGQFYQRELPCILNVLKKIEYPLNFIIIDGYVSLGKEKKPGLGEHLFNALEGKIPIIGVAKSSFKDTPVNSEIYRGKSRKPLYITSKGIDEETAKAYILNMNGNHRIPNLIKRVDTLCRSII